MYINQLPCLDCVCDSRKLCVAYQKHLKTQKLYKWRGDISKYENGFSLTGNGSDSLLGLTSSGGNGLILSDSWVSFRL
jgi:hypothetical protein